eukprot:snap_masked-scaffold_6-processed-gene-14.5-mRNA-1 protein AED:1.00 eAED:1.00 QI:0/-1/0/0/-1/1/1/0/340
MEISSSEIAALTALSVLLLSIIVYFITSSLSTTTQYGLPDTRKLSLVTTQKTSAIFAKPTQKTSFTKTYVTEKPKRRQNKSLASSTVSIEAANEILRPTEGSKFVLSSSKMLIVDTNPFSDRSLVRPTSYSETIEESRKTNVSKELTPKSIRASRNSMYNSSSSQLSTNSRAVRKTQNPLVRSQSSTMRSALTKSRSVVTPLLGKNARFGGLASLTSGKLFPKKEPKAESEIQVESVMKENKKMVAMIEREDKKDKKDLKKYKEKVKLREEVRSKFYGDNFINKRDSFLMKLDEELEEENEEGEEYDAKEEWKKVTRLIEVAEEEKRKKEELENNSDEYV